MERADLEQWRPKDVARLLALVEGQRRYFQEIVAALPVAVLVLSTDLEIILANGAVRRVFSLPEEGPLRLRLDTVLPAWVLDRIQQTTRIGGAEANILVDTQVGRKLRLGIVAISGWGEEGGREALVTVEDLAAVAGPGTSQIRTGLVPVREATSGLATSELAEELPAVLWAVDPRSMRPVFVSSQAQKLLGFSADFWTSNPSFWTDRVHAGDRERVGEFYQQAVRSATGCACEFRSVRADGQLIWLRETVRPVTDSAGKPIYLAGVTVDVTERRLLESQLVQRERVDAMQKLASRMAHDLNNMLMILEGNAEEVLSGLPASSELRGEMEAIVAAAQRINGLTGQLLAFGRREPVDAQTIELEPILSAIGTRLSVPRQGALSRSLVSADSAQLEPVLTSLVAAARKSAHPSASVTLETFDVTIREELQRPAGPLLPGEYAVIAIGVSDVKTELGGDAFERFLPEKGATDDTAAKLAQAYGRVREWGGDIAVASSSDRGTNFRLYVPRVGSAGVPETITKPAEPRPQRKGVTILIAEDEAGIRSLVQKFLLKHGYEVLEASDGEEALEVVRGRREPVDLLITDMIMPRMSGRELADRVHEHARDLKILYISGYTDDSTVYAAELPPGNAFLQKPFTLSALLEKVRALLGS